ncbi:MAG TPA: prolipoprotein diacylglyceryl transferase [bacterium]|nr:prolipoprotein diacylglyceryl transferase [bacterium]
MHPELFHLGKFTMPTYGTAYAFSVMLGITLSYLRAQKEGVSEMRFLQAMFLAMLGMIFLSKGMHIATHWSYYMDHPSQFLNLRKGHIFYGGYIGAILVPGIFLKIVKEPILPIIDLPATYMPLCLAIHRTFGCLMAGCCFGKPTELPWGIVFPAGAPASEMYGAVPVHPSQIYESLLALAIFAALLYWRKHKRKVAGEIITLQVALYAAGRFVLEFWRGDVKRGFYGPLSTSQWVSVAMLAIAAALTVYIVRERKKLAE